MARVLILGGSGFIGRHLVEYLYNTKKASAVCVADKVLYQIASLSEKQLEIYNNKEFLTFVQADLKRDVMVEKAFNAGGGKWDYVVNLAAVTKYSQAKEVYDTNIVAVSKECAAAAAKAGVKRYIEVSTSQVYDSKKQVKEDGKLRPWTLIGAASLEAEEEVKKVDGLNYVIVRPAVVYGPSDVYGITPRLIIGSVYKETGKKMESLYTSGNKFNTVHVRDVAKALVFLFEKGDSGSVFNLEDGNDTDAGKVHSLLEQIYGIKTGFLNALKMAAAAKMGTKFLVSFANDCHLKPFSDACKKYGIDDTPLTPYLDEELIQDNQTAVDGTAIKALGFSYDVPAPTKENLTEVLQDFIAKGFFPKELL